MAGKLSLPLILFFLLLASLFATPAAFAQQPRSTGGLWIEDASGQMDRWKRTSHSPRLQSHRTSPARIVLAVESFAHTATGALSANALSVGRVIRALSGLGISSREVSLESAFVEPEYERTGPLTRLGARPRIAGFRALRVLEIRTERKDRIGLLLDFATGAGTTRILEVSTGEEPVLR